MVSTAPKRAEKIADGEGTVRLTVAQATIRFLGNQYVEHDGARTKFFAGAFGIFGHGNVAGIGQALKPIGLIAECPVDLFDTALVIGGHVEGTRHSRPGYRYRPWPVRFSLAPKWRTTCRWPL